MAKNSNIEWCDHTFNPWIGCNKVSPGCQNCYAETLDGRWKYTPEGWGKGKPRTRTSKANWKLPLQWNKKAAKEGIRYKVFCSSLADWLDEEIPIEWLADLLEIIRTTPHLDWLLLTKRPENFFERIHQVLHHTTENDDWLSMWLDGYPPQNVWMGVSIENQRYADIRIPQLLDIPAKLRFLSCEPLLDEVHLPYLNLNYKPFTCRESRTLNALTGEILAHNLKPTNEPKRPKIDWVIVGGESGPGARPMKEQWAELIQQDCGANNTPFFMKQIGGIRKPFPPIPQYLQIRQFPT